MPSLTKDLLYLKALLDQVPLPQIDAYIHPFQKDIAAAEVAKVDALLEWADRLLGGRVTTTEQAQQPLHSVFESLLVTNPTAAKYGFAPKMLQLEKGAFPTQAAGNDAEAATALWEGFVNALGTLSQKDTRTFAETSLHLLHQYTVQLNNPLGRLPSVSFYDYARSRAGIAVCLYDYCEAQKIAPADLTEDLAPLVLIGADLSGIQPFIYNIVSKHASKNLKGRSFYLQLLSDSILQSLLQTLALYQGNVVYGSGGAFFVVAPNIPKVTKQFNQNEPTSFEYRIQAQLQATHSTLLSLAIDAVPISIKELLAGDIVEKKRSLMDVNLGGKKKQKFKFLLAEDPQRFFGEAVEFGGGRPRDAITSEEMTLEEVANPYYLDKDNKESGIIKESTQKQINLGTDLKNVEFWIRSTTPIAGLSDYEYNPCDIGIYHYLIPRGDFKKHQSTVKDSGQTLSITQFNQPTDFLAKGQKAFGKDHQFGFIFYGGNEYPGDEYEPKTFSEMAGSVDEEKKKRYKKRGWTYRVKENPHFKRLGFLRMDIDDLGYIIRKGMGEQLYFAQYTTLSRSLDYFFKGYLNKIWKANRELADNSQIIYSGGDDLFIVGRWDLMVDFAKAIKDEFKKWICDHQGIGISGGVAIVTHKFPAMKAAKMAGKAEDAAKDHEKKVKGYKTSPLRKKSFTILGAPLHWEEITLELKQGEETWNNEFAIVENLKEEFINLLKGKEFAAFIQQVQVIYGMSVVQEKQEKNPSWQWIIAYHLSRAKDRLRSIRGNREETVNRYSATKFLDQVIKDIYTNTYNHQPLQSDYKYIELLHFAARWAELEHRTRKALEASKTNNYV